MKIQVRNNERPTHHVSSTHPWKNKTLRRTKRKSPPLLIAQSLSNRNSCLASQGGSAGYSDSQPTKPEHDLWIWSSVGPTLQNGFLPYSSLPPLLPAPPYTHFLAPVTRLMSCLWLPPRNYGYMWTVANLEDASWTPQRIFREGHTLARGLPKVIGREPAVGLSHGAQSTMHGCCFLRKHLWKACCSQSNGERSLAGSKPATVTHKNPNQNRKLVFGELNICTDSVV